MAAWGLAAYPQVPGAPEWCGEDGLMFVALLPTNFVTVQLRAINRESTDVTFFVGLFN
jgi:hypothetical protein